jgi:glutamate carboxypeptidase
MTSNDLKIFLEENLDNYLAMLQAMVSMNSFTANPTGVNELGKLTADSFANLGFSAERINSTNAFYGDHLILSHPARTDNKPTIGLVSHLDTVFPLDEERRNKFHWQVIGDKAYGPGTVDIKGGTLIIYMMLDCLRQCAPELFINTNWIILLNAAEETLEPEFGQICREKLPSDSLACLVFEGGRLFGNRFSLVTARKGMIRYRIEVSGRAAHAGSAHKNGANAIVQLANTIADIASLTNYDRDITFNIGTVAGGTVINRVPHNAVASGEMRAYSPERMEAGIDALLDLQKEVSVTSNNGDIPCDVSISVLNRWSPWPENAMTNTLLKIWDEAAKSLGFEVIAQHRGGLSDGNHLWDHVPTIDGLGPSGGNAHCSERDEERSKDQEFILISSLVPKTMLNVTAVLNLLRNSERKVA